MDYSSLPADKLFNICANREDDAAWREFVRRFHPLIAAVVLRVCRQFGEGSRQAADDIIQDVYLKLCANDLEALRSFVPLNSNAVYGFVKVFAANHAHDVFKSVRAKKRGGEAQVRSLDDDTAPAGTTRLHDGPTRMERDLLFAQIAKCLEKLAEGPNAARDKRVFWLYYRLGLSASSIAALESIGLSTKGVESTIFRLTRAVRVHLTAKPTERERSSSNEGSGMRSRFT